MADLDVSRYLEPVSEDSPCGENLEYDPLLREIEEAAEGTPERTVGDSVLPGEEPDWRVVRRKSLDALERTRDVQVAVYLLRALLQLEGFPGLSQGLQLLQGLLDRYWDCVYPQQDEDDDYPILRVNLLTTLVDLPTFLNPLRSVPLTDSQVMGRYSLRDIEASKGDHGEDEDDDLPKASQIEAAFMDTDQEVLEANSRSIDRALGEVQAMSELLQNQVGAVNSPDFSPLIKLLMELQGVFREQLQRRGVQTEGVNEEGQDVAVAGQAGSGQAISLHAINSREDVQRAIDAINDYFQRQDPSSPIPFLLKRARRMLYMDFKEILENLAPDGLHQAEIVFGPDVNPDEENQ